MNCIVYLLDGLTPLAIESKFNQNFFGEKIKKNFISKLSKNSINFTNTYGYGETFSTTYQYLTGEDIYDNFCDSFKLFNSFPKKKNLAFYFKENDFNTFFFRNSKVNFPLVGFYGRYLESVTHNFDVVCKTKKNKNYSFKNFFKENKISKYLSSSQKNFFLFHDFSLHDNKRAYSNGTAKSYLHAVDHSSKIVQNNLKIINYDKKKDILVFISDHGLNLKPSSKIHFSSKLNPNEYQKYYKDLFIDEKLKVTFFIKYPNCKSTKVSNYYKPNFIFLLLKKFAKINFKILEMKKLLESIKNKKNKIIISIQAAKQDPFNNFFLKDYFHCHFLSLSKFSKIAYSHNHTQSFYDIKNKKFIYEVKNNLEFKKLIKNYFSLKNYTKKFLIFILSLFIRALNKFFRKFR